jgi:outer membrane lipoprotein-sorting protein
MTVTSRSVRRHAAWSAPVLTVATIGAAMLIPSSATASSHPVLPARTAAQLLADVQTSDVTSLSGTIVETARLGLPELPGAGDAATLNWQTLVTGTHTARVWLDGADRQRLALLGQLSESDVVHNGRDIWTYASGTQQVGHKVLDPQKPEPATKPEDLQKYTPQGAAAEALKAIDPSTVVTIDRTARVAGRPAYTLVLTPRDASSTVDRVLIAIDATHHVPLRVQVFGAATAPAFEIAFTHVSYNRPAASVFHFTPPKGATVTKQLTALPEGARAADPATKADESTAAASPTVIGTGWTSVLVIPASHDGTSPLAALSGGDKGGSILDRLTTTLPNGDRLLRSTLINALMTTDGRTLVGAVSPAMLEAAAGQKG